MKKYLIAFATLFILFSCKEKVKRYYYDSGELRTEEFPIKNNDNITYFKKYYKNGVLLEEGYLKNDSIIDGEIKIYYADGELRWKGEIRNNVIQDNFKWKWIDCIKERFQGVEIEGNPKELISGKTYKFRVIIPDLHPQFFDIVDVNYKSIHNSLDTDFYPYKFTCMKFQGNVFRIIFMDTSGHFIIGKMEYAFFITPSNKNHITKFDELKDNSLISVEKERKFSDGTTDTVTVYR